MYPAALQVPNVEEVDGSNDHDGKTSQNGRGVLQLVFGAHVFIDCGSVS